MSSGANLGSSGFHLGSFGAHLGSSGFYLGRFTEHVLRKRSEHQSLGKRGASDNPMQPVQNKKRNPTKEEPRVPTTIRQRGSHHEKPKNVDLNPKSFCVGSKRVVGKARTHRGMRVQDARTKLFL